MSTQAMLIVLAVAGAGFIAWHWNHNRSKMARWLAIRLLVYSDELRARADLVEAWKHNVRYDNVKESGRCAR